MEITEKGHKKNAELARYKAFVRKKFSSLFPIFARASIGDFSKDVRVSEEDSEFTDLEVGVQVMLGVIREQLTELQGLNRSLRKKLEMEIAVAAKERALKEAERDFVFLASHQLRTPLTAMKWYTEALLGGKRGPLNNDQRLYLEDISVSTARLIELVDALLNVSRIELGTFVIEPKRVFMNDLINKVCRDLTGAFAEKRLKLVKFFRGVIPPISVDPHLLRIVIENLLSNALKYTPPGGRITVSVQRADKDLRIAVADTGFGILKKDQKKVFEKFFRTDAAKKVDTNGTGLGLYITKSIVEALGGKIRFVSRPRRGSTFSVFIPFRGMRRREGTKQLV